MARTKGDYVRGLVASYRAYVVSQEMADRKNHANVFWEQLHMFHCSRVHFLAQQLRGSPRSARVHEKLAWEEIASPPVFKVRWKASSVHLARYRQLNEQFEMKENAKVENKNKAERIHTFYCRRVEAMENASEEELQACIDSDNQCPPDLKEYLKDYDCNGYPLLEFGLEDLLSEGDSD